MKYINAMIDELNYYIELRSTDENFISYYNFKRMVRKEARELYPLYDTDSKSQIYHKIRLRNTYIREKFMWYKRFSIFTVTYDIIGGIIFSIFMILMIFFAGVMG